MWHRGSGAETKPGDSSDTSDRHPPTPRNSGKGLWKRMEGGMGMLRAGNRAGRGLQMVQVITAGLRDRDGMGTKQKWGQGKGREWRQG